MFSNYVHFLRIQSIFTNNHHKIPQKIIIKKKGVRTESKGGVVEGAWKEKKKEPWGEGAGADRVWKWGRASGGKARVGKLGFGNWGKTIMDGIGDKLGRSTRFPPSLALPLHSFYRSLSLQCIHRASDYFLFWWFLSQVLLFIFFPHTRPPPSLSLSLPFLRRRSAWLTLSSYISTISFHSAAVRITLTLCTTLRLVHSLHAPFFPLT